MSTAMRFALAGAAVVVAAILGYNLMSSNVGRQPEPTPPPLPKAAESLQPGTYVVSGLAPSYTIILPDGWRTVEGFIRTATEEPGAFGTAFFGDWTPTHIYGNTCQHQGTIHETPDAAAIIDALANQGGHETTGPTETTFAGQPATRFVIDVPEDFDVTTCDGAFMRLWPDVGGSDTGGQPMFTGTTTLWVLDVDGQAVVFIAASSPAASEQQVSELQAIAESAEFVTGD